MLFRSVSQSRYAKPFRDVPCGKCAACMQRKRSEWSVRLQNELQYASSAAFITLTYSDEYFQELHPLGSLIGDLYAHLFPEDGKEMLQIKEFDDYLKDRTSVKKKELQDFNLLDGWQHEVMPQIKLLMSFLDRQAGKMNTWYIVGPACSGKSLFTDLIKDFF